MPIQAAHGASALCRALEADLAGASRANNGNARVNKFQAAMREQQRQIAIAQSQARKRGCNGSFSFFGATGGDSCTQINASLRSMRANLAKLGQQTASLSNGRSKAGQRARILARIEANRCREPDRRDNVVRRLPNPITTTAREDPGLINRIFGGRLRHRQSESDVRWLEPDNSGLVAGGATYRTLCVRTCDGYFFPVSFSTTGDLFGRDQQACEAMCPGVDVKLYAHRAQGEESEDMVSMDGTPYSQLPTAYDYKNPNISAIKGCACNAAKDFSVIAGTEPQPAAEVDPMDLAPLPPARPDPGLDIETATNLAGGLTAEAIRQLIQSKPVADSAPDAKVRVVGPAFLPDPAGALDLKSPGQTAVQ